MKRLFITTAAILITAFGFAENASAQLYWNINGVTKYLDCGKLGNVPRAAPSPRLGLIIRMLSLTPIR